MLLALLVVLTLLALSVAPFLADSLGILATQLVLLQTREALLGGRLGDWLLGWFLGWLGDWLLGWFLGWLGDWLLGWLLCGLGWSSSALFEFSSTSADLIVPSLETSVFSHRLSSDLLVKLAAVTTLILSIQTDSVLLITEALTSLALSDYESRTSLFILKLIEVGLLVPSRESWALLIESFQSGTSIGLL